MNKKFSSYQVLKPKYIFPRFSDRTQHTETSNILVTIFTSVFFSLIIAIF